MDDTTKWLIGLAVPLVSGLALKWRRKRPTPSQMVPGRAYVREDKPSEMYRVIGALPPLERDSTAKRLYSGKWVRWTGVLLSIRRVGLGFKMVARADDGCAFEVTAGIGQRAVGGLLREGDTVFVEAMILEVGQGHVNCLGGVILDHTRNETKGG